MSSLIRLLVRFRWARYAMAALLLFCATVAVAGAFAAPSGNRTSNFAAAAVFVVLAIAAAAAGAFLPVPSSKRAQAGARTGGYGASVVGAPDGTPDKRGTGRTS